MSSSCFCKRNLEELSHSWCFLYTELSYFSYHDFCCSRSFILENVRNFMSIKHSMVLRPTLLSPAYGIPVQIWYFASWELRCTSSCDRGEMLCAGLCLSYSVSKLCVQWYTGFLVQTVEGAFTERIVAFKALIAYI